MTTTSTEKTVYTTCHCNCGGNHECVLKAHVKDGKVIAVEPDDRYNKNIGREDEAVSWEDLIKVRLQKRPCVMGLAFHKYLYRPDRILYPLKRAPGAKRGEANFVRITWDEALTTIAEKMNETRAKYGPYSVFPAYRDDILTERLFSFWGAGCEGWGWCSFESASLMCHTIAGIGRWVRHAWVSASAPDMLANSKLIVLWGCEPTVGHQGPAHQFAWYIKLAREKGIPVIIVEPRYTVAARTLADQWLPIKPGTDRAMFMAMAHVIFQEDTWNKEFVEQFVDPLGFEKWRDYVMGKEDGIPKTPEWAESITGVPAETTRELARMVGRIKPAFLWSHFSVTRKGHGEETVGAFAALQAMMGYWGTPGAGPAIHFGPNRPIPVGLPWGPPGSYRNPKFFRGHNWAEAVLLVDKVKSGELSEEDFMRITGWRADKSTIKQFNPKLIFWGGGGGAHSADWVTICCDSANNQVKAMEKMDFIVYMHSTMTATARYADIILPARDPMWEEKNITKACPYGGFEVIQFCPGVVEPAGEVKAFQWVYVKLAEKLGIDPHKFFKYYTTDENWDKDWERYLKDVYQAIIEYYRKKNVDVPTWEEFTNGQFINCDELDDQPFTGWDEEIKQGKPFGTVTGKIELYSRYMADEKNRGKGEHYDHTGRIYDNMPGDWGDMSPYPTYKAMPRGMDDPLIKKYPLMLLTPHSRYRVHYLFWEHNWLKDHVYRHRVWIHPADAKARGIRDNDLIQVFNDRGKLVMPAYVTSRIMPGVVIIHQGGKFTPDESGVDFGASPSTVLGGEYQTCQTSAKCTNLVQIEKYAG